MVVPTRARGRQDRPLRGCAYDGDLTLEEGKGQWWEGYDPQRLYGPKHPFDALPDVSYVKNFYDRTRDLIDRHDPDLLYFDNTTVCPWGGVACVWGLIFTTAARTATAAVWTACSTESTSRATCRRPWWPTSNGA